MSFQEPEARILFPNPFMTVRLDGSEALNRDLLREIMKRRKSEPGIKRSNHQGWHSAGDFWSGTYYVHVPPADNPDDKYSGAIEFIDPRGSIGTNARVETPFTRGK